jgi:hypothetical protein
MVVNLGCGFPLVASWFLIPGVTFALCRVFCGDGIRARSGHSLFALSLQYREDLLEVLPLPQGIKIGVFVHMRYVLESLAHRIAQ